MGLSLSALIDEGLFVGGTRWKIFDVTFDSSLAAGGETIDLSAIGLTYLEGGWSIGGAAAGAGYRFQVMLATQKLTAYRTNTLTPAGTIAMTDGRRLVNYTQSDIKGSANTDVGIASGALPTNGGLESSLANAANTTAFTIAAQPDIPRNLSISFKNTNAGASTGNAVSVAIVGTYQGAAQTETISFSALELTSTVQNEVATKYGSKPFDTITSITPSAAQPANWQHAAGVGSKLALPTNLDTPAEADVDKLFKNAANLSPSGIVDTTNMTVNFGTLADGDDISVWYWEDYDGQAGVFTGAATTAAALAEATSANLASVTERFMFIGN